MKDESKAIRIKQALVIPNIMLFSIFLSSLLFNLIRFDRYYEGIWIYFLVGMILFCFIMLAIEIRRLFIKKPPVLLIHPDSLSIRGCLIEAAQMERIMVMGYFKPAVGVKVIGKKWVPTHLCFRFVGEEHVGIDELAKWAEQNRIRVVNKPFTRSW
ncbi:hypothetical protein [Paenibacillus spongiae]|uniref:Uncharacterized protein n=1 Tax=Paenibacillus spongiae TaxID=2909671 RepID=A0ABY5S8Z6_9BACL|nr:hypothetical protein [Paenibacillus spongiae]UVI29307.1 hypothetical protein L1F29_28395 [Paenibacillus spongiae]